MSQYMPYTNLLAGQGFAKLPLNQVLHRYSGGHLATLNELAEVPTALASQPLSPTPKKNGWFIEILRRRRRRNLGARKCWCTLDGRTLLFSRPPCTHRLLLDEMVLPERPAAG